MVDDYVEERSIIIALDEAFRFMGDLRDLAEPQRAYARRLAKQRLHQPAFCTRVLLAYAAHIVPDGNGGLPGLPTTPNGLALCNIHHAACNQNMLGVSPDYRVAINREVLEEVDGPMLRHGLQAMRGRALALPVRKVDRPDRARLAWRWEQFAG